MKKRNRIKKSNNLNKWFCFGFYPEGSMGHCTNIRFNGFKQRVEFINDNGLIDEFACKEILLDLNDIECVEHLNLVTNFIN